MNRDEVIRMAREAGILEPTDLLESNQWRNDTIRELERFAALVAGREREECAQIVEREAAQYGEPTWAFEIVNDIRARGEK